MSEDEYYGMTKNNRNGSLENVKTEDEYYRWALRNPQEKRELLLSYQSSISHNISGNKRFLKVSTKR